MRPQVFLDGRNTLRAAGRLLFIFAGMMLFAPAAMAQLQTQHVKGSAGLKAGSEPPAGGYVVLPLLYFYNSDKLIDQSGGELRFTPDLSVAFFGAGYSRVTTARVLGGTYGFTILFPIGANNRIQGTEIDSSPGAGLTDSVIVPVNLGWHRPRADFITAFSIFVPTGRYEDGAHNNTGLGMWGFEPEVGTTVYLDEAHRYHAATIASFDFQTKKKDSDTKVGTQMNLEGGVGGDFLKGGLTAGLSYYASFKLADDEFDRVPGVLIRGRNKTFALGPEATLAIAVGGKVRGFVMAKYVWETYARTSMQGGALLIQATLLTRPITVP